MTILLQHHEKCPLSSLIYTTDCELFLLLITTYSLLIMSDDSYCTLRIITLNYYFLSQLSLSFISPTESKKASRAFFTRELFEFSWQ